jgi:hypothetical protein
MENVTNVKLVKGEFSPNEAKEVLFSLITSKIRFHQLEVFSNSERNIGDIDYSEKRITELENSKIRMASIIEDATKKGKKIKINGTIEIEILE